MSEEPRKPVAFTLQDEGETRQEDQAGTQPKAEETPKSGQKPRKAATRQKSKRRPRALPAPEIKIEEDADEKALVPVFSTGRVIKPAFRWLPLLASALAALVTLWLGVTVTSFIEDLFARNQMLGWIGLGLAGIVGIALLGIVLRETIGLMRISRLGDIQRDAARAISHDEADAANRVITRLKRIYQGRGDTAWGLSRLKEHEREIMDPADRIRLAERDLMATLDSEASRIVARTSRRVALLTAVTPAAALDILLVAAQNLRMLREIATLYGGRPGTIGTFRLARMVISHLAVAGGLALSDGLIQQIIGKGLLGRLSSRLGEGAVNGILTARIGLAALDLCRPLPFQTIEKPGLSQFARDLTSLGGPASTDETS